MLKAIVLVVLAIVPLFNAARPGDAITLSEFNQTLYIKDEIYNFTLVPTYWVPLRVQRHTIYTASTVGQNTITKRALWEKRNVLNALAPEDYQTLESHFGPLPSYVKVDTKKRSALADGKRVIDVAPGFSVFVLEDHQPSEKRASQQGQQKICLHVPFFTACDNDADLAQVKTVIQAQNDALRTELDSYKRTNDARDKELANSLNKQKDLIVQLAKISQNNVQLIQRLITVEKTNLVQTQHGDQILHAQINSLKRVTNSILRFSNAMASTDQRQVVAQPAMSKLFEGYLYAMAQLTLLGNNTIVDQRRFNWTEIVLPKDSVKNVSVSTDPFATDFSVYYGFPATLATLCQDSDWDLNNNFCLANGTRVGPYGDPAVGLFIGPFHSAHYGLYNIKTSTQQILLNRDARVVVSGAPRQFAQSVPSPTCIKFLGYNMLSNFISTPDMLNGIAPGLAPLDFNDCTAYALTTKNSGVDHYRMFSTTEGVVVPFYSNCNRETLQATGLSFPTGYFSLYPATTGNPDPSKDTFRWGLYVKHQVSSTCYINIEPEWIGMSYYINTVPTVIANVPRGYRLNQFTVNPAGELASSLEFLYTPGWALVYTAKRTSTDLSASGNGNRVIVDEVEVLDGEKVLFVKRNGLIIDASDQINGIGNSGRDCIQQPLFSTGTNLRDPNLPGLYDFDMLDCFFQNDQQGVAIDGYLKGLFKTTGISRYNSKFSMTLQDTTVFGLPAFTFQLRALSFADFRFYIATATSLCPAITDRKILTDKCQFDFFYSGSQPVTVGSIPVTFQNSIALGVSIPISATPYTLMVGSKSCLQVTCRKTITSTYIKLETPQVSIVSADDLALETRLYTSLDPLISGTLNTLKQTEIGAQNSFEQINSITALFATIDFNMSKLFPYENFSALRTKVDAVTAKIATNYCSGPWDSVQCWFKDFGSAIIGIGIALVFASGIYCFLTRTTAGQRVQNKLCGDTVCGGDDDGYGDNSGGHQYSPDGDFQLLSTN